LALGGKVAHRVGFERDAAHETQRRAEVMRRLDQSLAPPAQPTIAGLIMRD
jgi:hypothetical protein